MKVNSVNTSPSFDAIKVDKIIPHYKSNDVTFYNNRTAMFEKPKPLFEGASCLIDAISTISKKVYIFLGTFDIDRLTNMLKHLPKKEFQNRMLYGIIGSGFCNTAMQLDNDEVLCLSDDMNVYEERQFEDFDLPIKSKGIYPARDYEGWFIRKLGLPVNETELSSLAKNIKSKGYDLIDWNTEQACKVDGNIYLLDYECAVKPIS